MSDENDRTITVNLAGTMPAEPANGLRAIAEDLIANPGKRRVAIVEFYAMKRVNSTDDGAWQAIVRFSQIEPIEGEHAEGVEHILKVTQDKRLAAEAAERGELSYAGGDEE